MGTRAAASHPSLWPPYLLHARWGWHSGYPEVASTLRVGTGHRRQQLWTSPPTQGQAAWPPPSGSGSAQPTQRKGRRKERPFKGSGEEKALGEARARALFPRAFIVRGVLGEEDRIVLQGLYQAGTEEDKRREQLGGVPGGAPWRSWWHGSRQAQEVRKLVPNRKATVGLPRVKSLKHTISHL